MKERFFRKVFLAGTLLTPSDAHRQPMGKTEGSGSEIQSIEDYQNRAESLLRQYAVASAEYRRHEVVDNWSDEQLQPLRGELESMHQELQEIRKATPLQMWIDLLKRSQDTSTQAPPNYQEILQNFINDMSLTGDEALVLLDVVGTYDGGAGKRHYISDDPASFTLELSLVRFLISQKYPLHGQPKMYDPELGQFNDAPPITTSREDQKRILQNFLRKIVTSPADKDSLYTQGVIRHALYLADFDDPLFWDAFRTLSLNDDQKKLFYESVTSLPYGPPSSFHYIMKRYSPEQIKGFFNACPFLSKEETMTLEDVLFSQED